VREIKFRAWHPDFGYSFNVQKTYDSWPWEKWCSYQSFNDLLEDTGKEKIVVEQFTGLKDRNGKDIYEGDIVRVNQGGEHYWIFEMKTFGGQFGGNIYGECFEHNLSTDDDKGVYTYEKVKGRFYRSECLGGKDSEVIGNIHQNGDLLK
jgi:uncharacterized phage protein (TIGR01671 family)